MENLTGSDAGGIMVSEVSRRAANTTADFVSERDAFRRLLTGDSEVGEPTAR
jgi:hypothetical protein